MKPRPLETGLPPLAHPPEPAQAICPACLGRRYTDESRHTVTLCIRCNGRGMVAESNLQPGEIDQAMHRLMKLARERAGDRTTTPGDRGRRGK